MTMVDSSTSSCSVAVGVFNDASKDDKNAKDAPKPNDDVAAAPTKATEMDIDKPTAVLADSEETVAMTASETDDTSNSSINPADSDSESSTKGTSPMVDNDNKKRELESALETKENKKQGSIAELANGNEDDSVMDVEMVTASNNEGKQDFLMADNGDKKREKEFKPHTTTASKKKSKLNDDGGDQPAVKELAEPNAAIPLCDDENLKDVLDLPKLYGFMDQNKNASEKLAGKDLLLLIGYTGAGKTSTTKYLAGTKFEYDEDKYDYVETFTPDGLEEFVRSNSDESVTKSIHATQILAPNGKPITICDTPGFGDTKGVEMEISNGLMIIRSLKQAASVKPILVVNGGELIMTARGGQLQKTLDIVITMFGKMKDFSAFEYVFTSCEAKNASGRIQNKLVKLLQSLQSKSEGILADSADKKESYVAILSDMIEKTSKKVHLIDLEDEDGAPDLFDRLLSNDLRVSSGAFVECVSKEALGKLEFQVSRIQIRLENALKDGNIKLAQKILGQLTQLASAISLPQLESAVGSGKRRLADFVAKVRDEANEMIKRCNEAEDSDKYQRYSEKLKAKLLEFSDMQQICTICSLPEGESYTAYLTPALEKLFAPMQKKLEDIKVSHLFEKSNILRDSLTKAKHLSDSLSGLFDSSDHRLGHRFTAIKDKVFSLIKVAASDLDPENDITSNHVEKCIPSVLFILDVYLFLSKSKIYIPGMEDVEAAVHDILTKTESTGNVYMKLLTKLTDDSQSILVQVSEVDPEEEAGEGTEVEKGMVGIDINRLECFCKDLTLPKLKEARSLLLVMVEAPDFINAVYKESQSAQSIAAFVGNLDHAVNDVVEKVTVLIEKQSKRLMQGENVERFKTDTDVESTNELADAAAQIEKFVEHEMELANEITRIVEILDETCSHSKKEWEKFEFQTLKASEAQSSNVEHKRKLGEKSQEYEMLLEQLRPYKDSEGGKLNDAQIKAIAKLGFDLSKFQKGAGFSEEDLGDAFFLNFEELDEFMKTDEDCEGYIDSKYNKDLYKWTEKQRKDFAAKKAGKKSEITANQIKALKSIGFNFKIKTRSDLAWDANFLLLVEFKGKYGHCNVLRKYVNGKRVEGGLGKWVANMRAARRGTNPNYKLTPDRIRRLDEIGFVWDATKKRL